MDDISTWPCHVCGNEGFGDGNDGFYYCTQCGTQAEDIIETGVDAEDFVDKGGDAGGALYSAKHRRARTHVIMAEPISQSKPQSQFWSQLTLDDPIDDAIGPTGPSDFGSRSGMQSGLSYEDYYNEVRMRYVMGMQLMIQFQCEALVEKFQVTPLICGLAGSIWLRFVASTGVFDDGWADDTIQDSEMQKQGVQEDFKPRAKYIAEPHNLHGERAVMIWYKALRNKIPLSCSLAVSFLVCHIARESILPTDIVKWAGEGKLPYIAAFVEIEKKFGPKSRACPISPSIMFKPSQVVPLQKLESMAATIAQSIGLDLPPVNFYAIASRYLDELALPVENILSHACRIQEWSMPPDLWLSINESRLPTRICVLSILIVAIRILYNVHGFGIWEMSLCKSKMGDMEQNSDFSSHDLDTKPVGKTSRVQKSQLDAAEILQNLESRYNDLGHETFDYFKDLPTYLKFCMNVVFAGSEPWLEDHDGERLIDHLWNIYENQKDSKPVEDIGEQLSSAVNKKRLRDDDDRYLNLSIENKKSRDEGYLSGSSADTASPHADDHTQQSLDGDRTSHCSPEDGLSDSKALAEALKEEAIWRMISDMEENRFCYIPPRVKPKRFDYLHYMRKKDKGAYTYAAHADYYILLRACAMVAQVDIRIMHMGVLSFERRLAWLEKRIRHCLNLTTPNVSCEHCCDTMPQNIADDSIRLSNLSI